jgi:hypothetical protein
LSPQREFDPTGRSSGIFLFNGFFYEGLFILGILWALVPMNAGLFFGIEFSLLEWFILSLLAGLVIQLATFGLKLMRFRSPVTNAELLSLFEEVKTDIGTGHNIQLWFRDIDRSVFLSTTNPLFKAILLSESTIADILERPEKGKVVLAREVLMMERVSPISTLALGLLIFVFISFSEGSFLTFGLFSFVSLDIMSLFLIVPFVAAMVLMVLVPLMLARSTRKIDKLLETIYGASPDAIIVEVLTGYKIPDEVIENAKQEEAEGKPSLLKKLITRSLIVVVVTIPVSFVILILISPRMLEVIMLPLSFSLILGFMAFMLTFLIIPMFSILRAHNKRSTDWDVPHPFADSITQFLGIFPDYQNLAVKAVKPHSDEMFGLVVERLRPDYSEETIFNISPHMLKDIQDVGLAGPLILSELRRKDIEKKYNRINYSIIGIVITLMTISFIWVFSHYSFELIISFFPMLIGFPLLMIPPGIVLSIWKRRAEVRMDVEIARKYPRFLESLQTLIDGHHTQPYGITSYKTRLERIKEHLAQ